MTVVCDCPCHRHPMMHFFPCCYRCDDCRRQIASPIERRICPDCEAATAAKDDDSDQIESD